MRLGTPACGPPRSRAGPLLVALDKYQEEAEQELQLLLGRRRRERIDGEIPRLLADAQASELRVSRL
jgi:uncharacterized protein YbaR (Trm112 family)